MGWTPERINTLKKLWQDGLSASQIAKQLGGVSRNAVIGKVHRLGLSGRAAPSQPARRAYKPPRAPRPVKAKAPSAAPKAAASNTKATSVPLPVFRVEEPGSATILTLGAHMCKWPIGDPASDNFTYCGRRAQDGAPYCLDHSRVAYQPQQAKKQSTGKELARSLRRYI